MNEFVEKVKEEIEDTSRSLPEQLSFEGEDGIPIKSESYEGFLNIEKGDYNFLAKIDDNGVLNFSVFGRNIGISSELPPQKVLEIFLNAYQEKINVIYVFWSKDEETDAKEYELSIDEGKGVGEAATGTWMGKVLSSLDFGEVDEESVTIDDDSVTIKFYRDGEAPEKKESFEDQEARMRKKYPGILLPTDVEGHGFSFFHEIFKKSINTGEPAFFLVSGVVFKYKYTLFDENFSEGLEVVEGRDEKTIDQVKKYSIDSVADKFRLNIAMREAGFKIDLDGNLINEEGKILIKNEVVSTADSELIMAQNPALVEVLKLLGLDIDSANNLYSFPRKFVDEFFNVVSSASEADAMGVSFHGTELGLFGKVDHKRGVVIHNPGGENAEVEETSIEDFVSEFGDKVVFLKRK